MNLTVYKNCKVIYNLKNKTKTYHYKIDYHMADVLIHNDDQIVPVDNGNNIHPVYLNNYLQHMAPVYNDLLLPVNIYLFIKL